MLVMTNGGNTTAMTSSQTVQLAVIITVPLATLLVTLFLATYCVYYWNCCKRRVGGADTANANMFNDEVCPEAIITYGETLSSLIRSSEARGITTGLSLLIQQSLISRTEILKQIGCSTIYKLHLGRWREEQLLVKLYTSHEPLWKNETVIYQIPLLRHDNLVTFLAAGTAGGVVGCTLLQYCQPETLSEHLQENSLTIQQMLSYITDVCRGLVHLHSELTKGSYTKSIVAHCQLTSDNVLVSCERKCMIWNLELAKTSPVTSVHLTHPHCEYYCLSPQVLVQLDNKLDIMCYVESDVYALGLLMWQLSKRCSLNGTFEEYEVPYITKLCSLHPTRHDLITLVCHQHYRPEVSHRLYSHNPVLDGYLNLMKQMTTPPDTPPHSIEVYEQLMELAGGSVGVASKRKTSNDTCSSCCSISDYTIETTTLPTVLETSQ